jgi:RNA polymerase sigma-32 factor
MNTAINNNLPILSNEGGLSAYLEQIKKFPMLDAEEEYMLAKNWKTTGNIKAAEKLVTSHLRLVAKIAQKKLFFNLKKLKNQIAPQTEGDLKNEHVDEIANKLDVSKDEVISMNRRLSGKEFSLNAQVGEDGDEWQDWLVDKELDHDLKFAHQEEMEQRKDLLKNSIQVLNEREREILYSRRLNDNPTTLEDLSKKYKISRERVRQIENKAFEKLQKHMLLLAKSKNLLPVN